MKSVTLSEVADQPQIVPKTGYTRQLFDKHFRPYRSKLRITMELASVGMIKRFVAAGLGVSIISESFAKDEVRNGEAKLIPISDADLTRDLGLVYRRDRTVDEELIRQKRLLPLTDPRALELSKRDPRGGERIRRDPADLLALLLSALQE